jgi:PAP2 superfamily
VPADAPSRSSANNRQAVKWVARNFHFFATIALTIGLPFALRAARFPMRFNWPQYFVNYWFVFGIRAVLGAAILFAIGCPGQLRAWIEAPRSKAPMPVQLAGLGKRIADVFLPAAYFFVGLIVAFSYNDIVAALRFDFRADQRLNRIDAWMMHGATVSQLAHSLAAHVSLRTFDVMTVIYFLLFPALGSTLVFLALQSGAKRATQFVGALMTSYAVVIVCFYFIPAVGPFVICADHFSVFPRTMTMYAGQFEYIGILKSYMAGQRPAVLGPHYFAALPCMHIAQPLIAWWFLRPWKRIGAIFLVFNILLVPCILLLEQHYLIDLLAGVPLAALAVALSEGFEIRRYTGSGTGARPSADIK